MEHVLEQYRQVVHLNSPYASLIRDSIVKWGDDIIINESTIVNNYIRPFIKTDKSNAIALSMYIREWVTPQGNIMPGAWAVADMMAKELSS